MAEKYKIVFVDGSEVQVEEPDIDEESRIVRVARGKTMEGEEEITFYDYYPFEHIKMIIFVSNN